MAGLFVAVVPPPGVRATLAAAVAAFRTAAPNADSAIRWVDLERWHITLAFLGPCDPGVHPELTRRLARTAARHGEHGGPTITLGGPGRFGDRVLWVAADGPGLAELARGTRRAAARALATPTGGAGTPGAGGGGLDEHRFRRHLTLGYARTHQRVTPAFLDSLSDALARELADAATGPLTWPATALELFDSTGGPRPEHRLVASWPLTGPAGAQSP
jgi:2'-5' RNA ligase